MGLSILFLLAYFIACWRLVAYEGLAKFQPAVWLGYIPIGVTGLYFVVPIAWDLELGPFVGPSDDGRHFGTAFIIMIAVPFFIISWPCLYLLRWKNKHSEETL
jgi:hypothetical protein